MMFMTVIEYIEYILLDQGNLLYRVQNNSV